jgi:hypothetical protein
MPTTYEPIATTTLGAATTTITFSSIPATYTDLRLTFVPIASTAMNVDLRFNNDSSSLYSFTQLWGDGSSAASTRSSNQTRIRLSSAQTVPAIPTLHDIDVFSYAGSTFKTALIKRAMDENGSGTISTQVGLYRSTTAINRIDIIGISNFAIGTTATLYGIKNA